MARNPPGRPAVRGPRPVSVARAVRAELLAHARDAAPNECCGLLVGRGNAIEISVRARNLLASPTRYQIDPADHFAAIHRARLNGRRVVGAYHSHPATAPVPSEADISEASGGSGFLYVIVSLAEHAIGKEIAAYRLNRSGAEPVALVDAAE
ncbi:MAG: M67 family peptidase [Acidobacteria bacterium]|nr:M67 family peptidase [Acidobacteriota bacterium]